MNGNKYLEFYVICVSVCKSRGSRKLTEELRERRIYLKKKLKQAHEFLDVHHN